MSYAFQPDEDWQPVVVAAYRSPIGRAFGSLATVAVEDLLVPIIHRILSETGIAPDTIDDVLVGNAAGGGGNIARVAALTAGLPMAGSPTTKSRRRTQPSVGDERLLDRELEDLPPELRWREWMLRVEAVIFASSDRSAARRWQGWSAKTAASTC